MRKRRYASGTSVTQDRSRTEIEQTLVRYGASAFMYGTETNSKPCLWSGHNKTRFA
jgi:hypothetical protein